MSFIKFGYYAFFHGEYDGLVGDANRGQTVAMLSIAALCVFYGLYPDGLFAILPLQGSFEAHPYTVSHLVEVLVLAGTGLVGFFAVKKLLKRAGQLPDLDAVYEPVTFYGTKYLVVGVTELYAAADRAAVRLARGSIAAARNPESVVAATPVLRLSISRRDRDVTHPMRAGIGLSVLVLVVVVTAVLVLLAVP
jgi:multicomponent Na+:H+ antiporter subunit D